MTKLNLTFGYNAGVPDDALFAWGCRAICTQDGSVDIVYDRQSAAVVEGLEKVPFFDALNAEFPMDRVIARLTTVLINRELDTRADLECVLHEGPVFTIKANCQSSAGYVYVAAYATKEPT